MYRQDRVARKDPVRCQYCSGLVRSARQSATATLFSLTAQIDEQEHDRLPKDAVLDAVSILYSPFVTDASPGPARVQLGVPISLSSVSGVGIDCAAAATRRSSDGEGEVHMGLRNG